MFIMNGLHMLCLAWTGWAVCLCWCINNVNTSTSQGSACFNSAGLASQQTSRLSWCWKLLHELYMKWGCFVDRSKAMGERTLIHDRACKSFLHKTEGMLHSLNLWCCTKRPTAAFVCMNLAKFLPIVPISHGNLPSVQVVMVPLFEHFWCPLWVFHVNTDGYFCRLLTHYQLL